MTRDMIDRWAEPVDPKTFLNVEEKVERLYTDAQYEAAYALTEKTWPGLPLTALHPSRQDVVLNKACLLARLDRAEETLHVIRAMHECGYSCPLSWATFDLVRSLPEYADIERTNTDLIREQQANARRLLHIHLPKEHRSESAWPLCLLLHGDGGSMEEMERSWAVEPLLRRGFIVAFVQSSQAAFTNHFRWLADPEMAWRDLQESYDEIGSKHAIDEQKVLVGGFSGGAITAVDLVFGEAIPARGFICLCPEIKPAHFTPERVEAAARRGVRGVFLEGDLVWPLKDEQDMVDVMKSAGFPLQLILNEHLGHAFPQDFESKLETALDFVLDV